MVFKNRKNIMKKELLIFLALAGALLLYSRMSLKKTNGKVVHTCTSSKCNHKH
ncbi:MAG: hypothetical protein ACJAZS_000410 [Alteromonas naphthalenivorans]|jgi:hypothetical protein